MNFPIQKKRGDMVRSVCMSAIFILICVLVIAGPTHSQGPEKEETKTLKITHVSENDFHSDQGSFVLNQESTVYNEKGEISDLRYIRLPCKADVTYKRLNKNSFVALEVNVLEIIKPLDIPK